MNFVRRLLVGTFSPASVKAWFPFVSKLATVVAAVLVAVGNPEAAQKLLEVLGKTLGYDEAAYGAATAALVTLVSIVRSLVNDVQIARGKEPVLNPIVKTPEGHQVYAQEYDKQLFQKQDYTAAVKTATARAKRFEQRVSKLANELGISQSEAFTRAKKLLDAGEI